MDIWSVQLYHTKDDELLYATIFYENGSAKKFWEGSFPKTVKKFIESSNIVAKYWDKYKNNYVLIYRKQASLYWDIEELNNYQKAANTVE